MIKQFFKKVLISYLIIICCIYTPTAQAAGFSFGGFNFGSNSLNIVKDGVKITTAAVDSAPITSNLAKRIVGGALRGASLINAISIIAGIGIDAVDWVIDPANNSVRYKVPAGYGTYQCQSSYADSAISACQSWANNSYSSIKDKITSCTSPDMSYNSDLKPGFCTYVDQYGRDGQVQYFFKPSESEKTIPIPDIAQKIFDTAKSGNPTAQADVTAAVADLVSSGTYDTPINQAIQVVQANTNNPANPNDNTNTDNTKPKDIPALDTSSITAAIASLAAIVSAQVQNLTQDIKDIKTKIVESFTKQTDAINSQTNAINNSTKTITDNQTKQSTDTVNAINNSTKTITDNQTKQSTESTNAINSVINSSIDKITNKQDQMQGELVNTGSKIDAVGGKVVGVGDKVDSVGGKVVGVGEAVKDVGGKVVGLNDSVKDIGGKVVGLNDNVTTVGDKVNGVGDKVDAVGDKVGDRVSGVGADVRGVGDKVTGVGADVRGVGDKITGVGDRVSAVGDKVTASNDKVADKVDAAADKITNAIKEKDKDKPESKPFELPAFCSWASKVCDFIDWVKKDPELPPDDNTPLVKDDKDSSFIDDYANRSYVNFSGQCPAPPVFNIFGGQIVFPMDIVCKACEQMSWVFISFAWLRAVMIVFFASKG